MSTASAAALPELKFAGASIDVREHIEPGTGSAKALGVIAAVFVFLILIGVTYGVALITLPIGLLADYFNRKKTMALLRGSAVEVGPQQLPELHACGEEFARRLGLREAPAIYIVEGNVINAAATRIGSRQVITLIDDVVDACLRSGNPRALGFVLAHEMAHHALGHTARWQTMLARSYKKLSRLNELSADSVARALVGDPQVAALALLVLMTGPQLAPYVDRAAILRQAQEVENDKVTIQAERRLSHPLLLRRLQRVLR
jgi:Zn-dependent protease with chaperone function